MRNVLALVLAALLWVGCAAPAPEAAAPPPPATRVQAEDPETLLMVQSQETQDLRVYLSVVGRRTLIGSVPARQRRTYLAFDWPSADSLAFAVAFADGRRCATEADIVSPQSSLVLFVFPREWNRPRQGEDGVWRRCRFEEREG